MTDQITDEDFAAWKHHPVTKEFFKLLNNHLAQFERSWLADTYHSNMDGRTMELHRVAYQNKKDAYEQILNMQASDLHEEKEETETDDEGKEHIGY